MYKRQGPDYEKAMTILQKRLAEKSMNLNPKKVEYLTMDKWFKFLGFSIKGLSLIHIWKTVYDLFKA